MTNALEGIIALMEMKTTRKRNNEIKILKEISIREVDQLVLNAKLVCTERNIPVGDGLLLRFRI